MRPTSLPVPTSFHRAMTLRERAALPRDAALSSDADSAARGALRWAAHRALPGLRDGAARAARWEALGLTEAVAEELFCESERSLAARRGEAPSWADVILAAYGGDAPLALRGRSLSSVAGPLAREADRALTREAHRIAAEHPRAPFRAETVSEALLRGLEGELGRMMQRTLVLEMHVARLEGRLSGDTGEERFDSHLRALAEPGAVMHLFDEYPVLARLLGEHVERTVAAHAEMLARLAADWPELCRSLSMPEYAGEIVSASVVGDRHDGGRAVTLLAWSSGAELAYKPKPLAADKHFQELVSWLNERGASPPLRTLPVLDRGRYGYTAMVYSEPCRTRDEVQRFFERQGELLGLFYGLLATDFHCENVMACGEHPCPVDLESLFHGELGGLDGPHADGALESDIVYSVLRVGLLPERAREGGGAMGVDLSGLGGEEGQLSPSPQPTWEQAGTDGMRLVRKPLPVIGGNNRPFLDGAPVRAFDWTESLVTGMTRMYRLLVEHRAELCAAGGPLSRFEGDVVRTIARPTRVYASLLGESFHPDLLRDALDRDVHFDRLWSFDRGRERLSPLVDLEQQDLWRGDIPKLTTTAAGRDLLHTRGRIPGFFEESGLDLARGHLLGLGPADLSRQQWIVRAAMVTLATDARSGRWVRYTPDLAAPLLSRDDLVRAAERIGERLADKAIGRGEEVSWLGLAFVGDHWVLAPLGTDLYGGLLGVALFLAQLGATAGRGRYSELARRAVQTWIRKERDSGERADSVGGYGGLGGLVYGLARLARLLGREELLETANRRMEQIPGLLGADETLDVLSGSAGAVGALVAFDEMVGSPRAVEIACQAAERLLARAAPIAGGLGWPTEESGGRALAGFSHGAAGIAWALLRLFERTGETAYREAALGAIRYERSLFVPAEGNYYDLRPAALAGKDPQFTYAWCHGAPGVGLARAAHLGLLDERAREEVRVTSETTLGSLGRGHSLCHGDLGNLELGVRAAEVLGDAALELRARRGIAAAVASGHRDGWLSGVPLAVETPGLMVGLAGMGYQLLRFACPEEAPSILLLEAPLTGISAEVPGLPGLK